MACHESHMMSDCKHISVTVEYEFAEGTLPPAGNCIRKFRCSDCGKALSADDVAERIAPDGDLFDKDCITIANVAAPRRFWQFHLSTAFILMISIGGVLGANVMVVNDDIRTDQNLGPKYFKRGFPATFETWGVVTNPKGEQSLLYERYHIEGLIMNVFMLLPVLMFIAFFSELVARNHEARKP
jgi:hypothetical protein